MPRSVWRDTMSRSDTIDVRKGKLVLLALTPVMLLIACNPDAPERATAQESIRPPESTTQAPEAEDPADIVRRVHQLRLARKWFELEPYIDPEQREPLRHLVTATDALLDANLRLKKAIIKVHGFAPAIPFDRAEAANALGLFSHDVQVLGAQTDGNRAVVTIQVADRVPVERVMLTRTNDRWLIRTDPPIEELPRQIDKLAGIMNRAAMQMESERLSIEELKATLDAEQEPVLRRIARLSSDGL